VLRRPWARAASLVLLAAAGVATAPLALPVLPVERLPAYQRAIGLRPSSGERFAEGELPVFFANMFGWDRLASLVDGVYRALPPDERARGADPAGYMQARDRLLRAAPRAAAISPQQLPLGPAPGGRQLIADRASEKDCAGVRRRRRRGTFRDRHISPSRQQADLGRAPTASRSAPSGLGSRRSSENKGSEPPGASARASVDERELTQEKDPWSSFDCRRFWSRSRGRRGCRLGN
jgi:hypothetical protein